MKTVGIIGGSGFIGSHLIKKFLAENYRVKVSVVDIFNVEGYKHLISLPNAKNLEIVPLEVENKHELKLFSSDCNILVYGATPVKLGFNDQKTELIEQIPGVNSILETIRTSAAINKIVLLGLISTTKTNLSLSQNNEKLSKIENQYVQANLDASQAVENFIKKYPEIDFEITSIYPSFVVGEFMAEQENSISNSFKDNIILDPFVQMLSVTNDDLALVDVKDVTNGIYKAAITKGLHGKNYVLNREGWKSCNISEQTMYKNDVGKHEKEKDIVPVVGPLNEFSQVY